MCVLQMNRHHLHRHYHRRCHALIFFIIINNKQTKTIFNHIFLFWISFLVLCMLAFSPSSSLHFYIVWCVCVYVCKTRRHVSAHIEYYSSSFILSFVLSFSVSIIFLSFNHHSRDSFHLLFLCAAIA